MAELVEPIRIGHRWDDIRAADCPLVIERRALPFPAATIEPLLRLPEFELLAEGYPSSLAAQISEMPKPVVADVVTLADRFARFLDVDAVRVRIERIDRNACKKIHADYVDIRLLCTYAGPGTEYVPDPAWPDRLSRMEAGWVGLFKGRTYAEDHEVALHRSPPIEGTGAKRLLLVIDMPRSLEFL